MTHSKIIFIFIQKKIIFIPASSTIVLGSMLLATMAG